MLYSVMVQKIPTWLSDPINVSIVLTYALAVMQAVYSQTQWRWAGILVKILESLPGLNLKGLITAGIKDPTK